MLPDTFELDNETEKSPNTTRPKASSLANAYLRVKRARGIRAQQSLAHHLLNFADDVVFVHKMHFGLCGVHIDVNLFRCDFQAEIRKAVCVLGQISCVDWGSGYRVTG